MKSCACASVFAATVALLFHPSPASAQRGQTSGLSGLVRDGTGARLVDVTVTVASPQLVGGPQSARTDTEGRYRLTALPPGSYTITAAATGFETLRRSGVDLLPGLDGTVDLVLNVAGVTSVVEVRDVAPAVDVRSSASPQVIERALLENLPLPMSRSVQEFINLTPGVAFGVALGGAAHTNPITVDGTTGTDPAHGRPDAKPVVNWLESLQVVSVGAGAEHGEYTSARLNAITRSGSNRFSGLGEYWLTMHQWAKWNELLEWWDTTGQVGGPVLLDRVWFFGGANYFRNVWRPASYAGRPRTPEEPEASSRERKFLLKLTTAPTPATRLEGFIEREAVDTLNTNATPLVEPEAYAPSEARQSLQNVRFTWVISDRTLFEAAHGGFSGTNSLGPADPARREGPPPHRDQATGAFSGNVSNLTEGSRRVTAVQAALTQYLSGRGAGDHEIKIGVEHERARRRQWNGYPGDTFYLDRDGAPELVWFWEGQEVRPSQHRTSVFVQDSWRIGRLTFQPGVRAGFYDTDLPDTTMPLYSNYSISPRLGAAWDMAPDHRTVVRAHYGHYHDALMTGVYESFDPLAQTITIVARVLGPGQFEEVTRTGGAVARGRVIDPEARHSYAEETFAGVEREVFSRVSIKAQYIRRNTRNALGYLDTGSTWTPVSAIDPGPDGRLNTADDGGPLTVFQNRSPGNAFFVLTNPDGAWRRYDALQLIGTRRHAGGWSLQAWYTWSRTTGSFDNETASNAADTDLASNGNFANPNRAINTTGRTVFDRSHDVRVFGTYMVPYWGGVRVGGVYRFTTGAPWGRIVNSFGPLLQASVLMERLGTRRLPSTSEIDLRIEKTLRIRTGTMGVYADVFNLTNRIVATRYNEVSGSAFGVVRNWSQPRRFRAGVRLMF